MNLKSKSYEEVNSLLIQDSVVLEEDLNKIKLKGEHLWSAFEAASKSGKTTNDVIISSLMEQGKVPSKVVANAIANWLKSYVASQNSVMQSKALALAQHVSRIEEKLKKMREAKPSLPPQLYNSNKSEIRMLYRQEHLRPSICFGPPLPAEKYIDYLEFLGKDSKDTIFPVLSLIEPSGYGKTHFMLDRARNGTFAIPISMFFKRSVLLREKITKMIDEKRSRSYMEVEIIQYTTLLVEMLNCIRADASLEEFIALVLFNGVFSSIAASVDNLYFANCRSSQSFNNVIFVLDEAHDLLDIFPNCISRSDPTAPLGNALTLLTASCRQLAPVVLMSTQRTFDNLIDTVVSGGDAYTRISSQMNRLPPVEYGKIIPFLDKFINTDNIGRYEKLLMQQILQGQMRYLDYFIVYMSKVYAQNTELSVNETVRRGLGRLLLEFGATKEVEGLLSAFEKKVNSITKIEAIMTELLIVFGKLLYYADRSTAFEEYMRNNGIGYAKPNERNTYYYRDLIISAHYQMKHLDRKMIARWVLEWDNILQRCTLKYSHLFELFLAERVFKLFSTFKFTKPACFFARDLNVLKSKNGKDGQELRFASLLVSEMKEKSYKQLVFIDKLVALPAEQNGPDFVTICEKNNEEGVGEDYLCSASVTLQPADIILRDNGKQKIKTIIEKIVKDVIKTNPWFYWINQNGDVEFKLDREHILKYLNAKDSCLKCLRLVFLPNISLESVKNIFGVTNVAELHSRIQEIWRSSDYGFKKAFTESELKQILEEDKIDVKKAPMNQFTVETKRDRIVFITQDHPFYKECNKDELSNLLFKILSYNYEMDDEMREKKDGSEAIMELKEQLKNHI